MSEKNVNIINVTELPLDIKRSRTYIIHQSNPNYFTHGMFKYPCKFIPEIPKWAINKYASKDDIILDCFAGSGTTLLEANINGYNAIGLEIDFIAKLLIKVKTTKLSKKNLRTIKKIFNECMETLDSRKINPYIPKINNLYHWFKEDVVRDLGIIKTFIDSIEDEDIKDFFYICFVSIIKRVSNADNTSPKPYVSGRIEKKILPVREEFISSFDKNYSRMEKLSNVKKLGKTEILNGDALDFELNSKVNLVIASPPYINAFDYGRIMRLENLWLDYVTEEELRERKSRYVGTEKIKVDIEESNKEILEKSILLKIYFNSISKVDNKRALIVKKFFEDMYINLSKVYQNLYKNGHYIIVIGNSNIRKVNIESWKVLKELALDIGYTAEMDFNYVIQNPYLRIPRKGKGGKINNDYILVLSK